MIGTLFSCDRVQDDLKAFRDGELSLLHRALVRRHLARCAACREEIEIMAQLENHLREAENAAAPGETAALPANLRERILSALPASPTAAPSRETGDETAPAFRIRFAEYAALGTVAVLLIVTTLSVMGRRVSNTFGAASNQMSDHADSSYLSPSGGGANPGAPTSGADTEQRYAGNAADTRPLPPAAPNAGGGSAPFSATPLPDVLRRVHKEGSITVAVDDLEAQSDAVEQMVRSSGGFVVSNNLNTAANGAKNAALEIRVPVKQFENVLGQIAHLGEVRAKRVSGQDITEQTSDAQQAKNVLSEELSIREAQLRAAENKRKKNPGDEWQLRVEVRRLRIEAAQARARLELLRKLSDLSNLSVQLQEKERSASQGGFTGELAATGSAAADTFLLAARVPLNLVLWTLAYSPLWLPLLLLVRLLWPRGGGMKN